MKKIFLAFGIFALMVGGIGAVHAGAPVFDGGGADDGLKRVDESLEGSGIIRNNNLIKVILAWVRVALALMGTIAFVAFVWAGFLYVTSFANEENAEKAKKVLIWTAIGIIVILLAYTFTSALINANFGG